MADSSGDARRRSHELRPSRATKPPSRYRDFPDEEFAADEPEQQNPSYGSLRDTRQGTRSGNQHGSPSKTHGAPGVDMTLDYPSDSEKLRSEERDVNYVPPTEPPPPAAPRYTAERYGTQGADLSDDLKGNLRKLKNVLKLPKARRFVFCEFFYSGVDQQLFLAENEFSQLMKESFPNLKTFKLRKPEWREVRQLIGKPRRCSQVFLNEERESLEAKRQKIRSIYDGSCTSLGQDLDLPALLPRPPVVGMKVYARVRTPKDGIYAGTIDAVLGDSYRIVFDKDELIPPSVIKDYEIMFDQPQELLAINYFLETNRANKRGTAKISPMSQLYSSPSVMAAEGSNRADGRMALEGGGSVSPYGMVPVKKTLGKDEKVGNFPVRMLVILVKLCKVIEYKKQLIASLTWMNDNAEKMNLLANEYPHEFKVQYAQLVLDIEAVNKLFKTYLSNIQSYHNQLLPHLNHPLHTDRPEVLRRQCDTNAFQIVKHCNNELNVKNKQVLQLITSLTSILLQIRAIGNQKKRYTPYDLNILAESLKQVRSQVLSSNAAVFQDYVEVHMKQIHKMLVSK